MIVRLAMKYSEIESGQIDNLIRDDEVVFEQKFDGTRVMAVIVGDGTPIRFLQSGGKVLAHTAATQHLEALRPVLQRFVDHTPGELVLDGELMISSGEYHLFDVPYARFGGLEVIQPTDPYYKRRGVLKSTDVAQFIYGTPVFVTEQATTAREKRALLDAVRDAGGEGVMAKNLFHGYEPGKRSKQAVKLKFVYTVDVVVMEVTRPDVKHGSTTVGAYNADGELVKVGACSLIGKPEVKTGDVVELAILYWTGSSLYQPRLTRLREDKDARDCTFAQFKPYSRKTISLG